MKKILVLTLVSIVVLFAGNAFAVEIITNGGFESGLTDWSATSNVIATGTWWGVSPTVGSYQAVMSPFGFFDSELWQKFSVDPALYTDATISFDYNLKALDWTPYTDWGTDYFVVAYDSTEILQVPLNDVFGGGATTPGWQTFSATYPASALSGPMTFKFNLENFPPDGGDWGQNLVAYIDNVSIDAAPVPEPSSMLLFGSGLLGLIGFRLRKRS